jgi:hypothetical protein
MPTLSVKDIPHNEEMDSNDMAAIEGGFTLPATLNVPVVKLTTVPPPVTNPNKNGDYYGDGGGGNIQFYNSDPYGDDLREP